MKLRNKKTDEVKEVIVGGYPVSGKTKIWEISEMDCNEESGYKSLGTYNSLAELNAEWEDAPEEPKDFWYIRCNGAVKQNGESSLEKHHIDEHKEIGNYFLSQEEAEKAVEKLKAWKRLEEKGFRFDGHDDRDRGQLGDIVIYAEMPTFGYDDDSTRDDIDLLFSGGEE